MKKVFVIAALALVCAAASAQNYKFAHVNLQELIYLSPEADQARKDLNVMNEDNQTVLEEMYNEYQQKLQAYQQKGSTWTETVRASKEKELQQIGERFQETQQSIQQEMQYKEQELYAPIIEKATNVVNELAKKYDVIYVFDAGTAFYVDETKSINLTPEARVQMNIPEGRTLETLQAELQAQAQAQQK